MTEGHQETPGTSSPNNYQGIAESSKPLLAFGAAVLVVALLFGRTASFAESDELSRGSDSFNDLAIMGGVKRTSDSRDFRGGGATAVMGGVDIDLRDAVMNGSEAVLDVSTVMGGVKVRVPDEWTVVSRVNTVMGGFKDRTKHPSNKDYRLILKGTLVMGGLTVTN